MLDEAVRQLAGKWWTFLLRGIVALAVAAYAFSAPGGTAIALVYVVAAYFIVSGLAAIFAGVSLTGVGHWWAMILLGIVQAGLGVMMLAEPGIGPLSLAYLFSIWMISTGLTEISSAIALRNVIENEFWLGLFGAITLAFGVYVVIRPDLGLLALVYTVGFYGIFAGISLIGFAFRIKGIGADVPQRRATA
jgi:uncharacterized membrane protein HdeD (DUF308 family)